MPAVQERFVNLGLDIGGSMRLDDFLKLLRADWDQAGQLVKASGAKVE